MLGILISYSRSIRKMTAGNFLSDEGLYVPDLKRTRITVRKESIL